ncbi:MAG: ammonium transporter [Candidatus Lokiarchaeota archaeon]|nr:ammonium transporter [Candidatus Lokiarchaeota archaeon]
MAEADIALIFVCTALVFIMTPGLAFFYGGLLRKKSMINMMAMCFVSIAVVSVLWFFIGYSLAFSPDVGGGFIGGFDYIGLYGIKYDDYFVGIYTDAIPQMLYMVFQLMFAIITVAIIASPFAERVNFGAFIIFISCWLILVYSPIAHWVWGEGGWLRVMGALDFAGGTVVHINVGFASLAVALVIGPRKGYKKEPMEPSNVPYVLLGTALLWIGWFAFNGGSALGANDTAVIAMFNTHLAACAAGFVWMIIEYVRSGKFSMLGLATGALAGLVAVTPASGFIEPWAALIIGVVVAPICYTTLTIRNRSKIDESLDAWAVHGWGGIWGAIATGIFATIGATSAITGNPGQIWTQIVGVIVTAAYSFIVTFVIAIVIHKLIGLRSTEEEEYIGLDISCHGEIAQG